MHYTFESGGPAFWHQLGEAYGTFSENHTRLETFRTVASAGLEGGLEAILNVYEEYTNDVLLQYKGDTPESTVKAKVMAAVRHGKARETAIAIEAATVVFAHAVIERLIHDLLDILAHERPAEVAGQFPDRKVRIGDIRSKPADDIWLEAARPFIEGLKRESLERKIAFLFDLCGFLPACQKNGYCYDQTRLLALDQTRQELLHRRVLAGEAPPPDVDLKFVHGTGIFFLCIVTEYLGGKVNLFRLVAPFLEGKRGSA